MNNSFSYYTYLSKILKINKTKEIIEINNDRNSKLVEDIDNINNNIELEKELDMIFSFLIEILNFIINDLTKMNKQIYREQIFDSIINCVQIENKKEKKKNENKIILYNKRMLNYILYNIKDE